MANIRFRQADIFTLGTLLLLIIISAPRLYADAEMRVSVMVWVLCVLGGTGLIVLRGLYPSKLTDVLAAFWPVPMIPMVHETIKPVMNFLCPEILDDAFAAADLAMFGVHPSVWAEPWLPPAITDLLMVCYTSFYLWPVVLGIILYRRGDREAFELTVLLFMAAFFVNFGLYLAFPVIGPRFALSELYTASPRGLLVGTWLYDAYLGAVVIRDCFPSGHTAITLLTLWQTRRLTPTLFRIFIPVGTGIIAATVFMRFHYVLDLVAAVPFAIAMVHLSFWSWRRLPEAWELPLASEWSSSSS